MRWDLYALFEKSYCFLLHYLCTLPPSASKQTNAFFLQRNIRFFFLTGNKKILWKLLKTCARMPRVEFFFYFFNRIKTKNVKGKSDWVLHFSKREMIESYFISCKETFFVVFIIQLNWTKLCRCYDTKKVFSVRFILFSKKRLETRSSEF